jgi:cytochrome c oxidase assembly protein subunit 15
VKYPWLNRILMANVIVQSGIIATGAVVRVSNSGLGCPSWPQCTQGSYTPTVHQAESWHKWIEYGNRTLTGVLLIVAVSVLVGVFTVTTDRKSRLLAVTPLVLTFGQAILGGITVITGLNPYTVASHFLLSASIVILSVRLWWRMRGNIVINPDARSLSRARILLVTSSVVVFLGVVTTGSGPHSGDAKAEARFPLDPAFAARIHAVSVTILLASAWMAYQYLRSNNRNAKALIGAVIIIAAQATVGLIQYTTGLPATLVGIHVALAATFWAAINITVVQMMYPVSE